MRQRLSKARVLGLLLGSLAMMPAWVAVPGSSPSSTDGGAAAFSSSERMRGPILPVPVPDSIDSAKAELGRQLFHEPRLSSNDRVSCASCHDLRTHGVDGQAFSVGVDGKVGAANAPTVYNSALNAAQFWDGRAHSLESQIEGPVHNPVEMASDWSQVIAKLEQDPRYVGQFDAVFEDGITAANIEHAIAEFERTLMVTDSPFDRYLGGFEGALSEEQEAGYEAFCGYGCVSCHQGANVGGNIYQQMGLFGDYFADRGGLSEADRGRFNVTGDEQDLYYFKVPSLRLAAYTAPYFHDGSVATLERAIEVMGRYQVGRRIPDNEVRAIAAFIRSLAGPLPQVRP